MPVLPWLSDHLLGWLGPQARWEAYTHWVTWRYLLLGLKLTAQIALFTILLSLAFGLLLAVLRTSPYRWLSWPAATYIEGGRAVPALLIVLFTYLAAPRLQIALSAVNAAIVGLTIYNAAVMAEFIRAGIESIGRGQIEASRALGLSYLQTMRFVALPTALRRMAPALAGQVITINKDTSFASVISVQELLRRGEILNTIGFNPVQN